MALRKVGAFWKPKPGSSSKTVMSGELQIGGRDSEKLKILLFKVENKKNERGPDYEICVREDDEQEAPATPDNDRSDLPF